MLNLKIFKQKFDVYLEQYLNRKISTVNKLTKDTAVLDYINYLKKVSLSGGKRIRPYLAYSIYQTLSGEKSSFSKEEKILKFLVSLEIFHIFCLVHDDIMDKSTLRHGIPTSHTYISNMLKRKKIIGDLNHVGNSQAILLGDLLLSWSQNIVNSNKDFPKEIIDKVGTYFYEMIDEVSIGQMIDVDIATRKNVSKELIDEKTRRKTADYSFIKPLLIGAALAGNNNKNVEAFCEEFGLTMGFAFQIQDDLLSLISSDEELGKTASLDKSQNQHTYFTFYPSLKKGKEVILENLRQARILIKKSQLNEDGKKRFFDLVNLVEKRKS